MTSRDSRAARAALIGITALFFAAVLLLPLALVFTEAFGKGAALFASAITDPAALSAIRLTLTTALIVVPLNTLFGLFASWAIARFEFRGKAFLLALIDLPFAVSPVVAGLIFVLLLGSRSALGGILGEAGIRIIYAPPGIALATLFVTFPFVARELIPLMQSLGRDDEEAALTLGAGGWQTFFRVTLPNIKWGLAYGVVLCNARAIGEFGAVSVVSGHIRGKTNTIPLHVEILFSEYRYNAAFAVSTILVAMALAAILLRGLVEGKKARRAKELQE